MVVLIIRHLGAGSYQVSHPTIIGPTAGAANYLVDPNELLGQFVAGDVTFGLGEEIAVGHFVRLTDTDDGHDFVAPPLTGSAYHHAVIDGGMSLDGAHNRRRLRKTRHSLSGRAAASAS